MHESPESLDTAASVESAPVRQRRKEARPSELLDAALDLFVQKGFAATRAEEVATRAGVSKGTLYLYYASKEDLLKAVIHEHLSAQITAGAEQVDRHQGTVAELLRELLADWWLRVLDGRGSGVFKLVITEVRSFPEIAEFYQREVIDPGRQLLGRILQRGIDSGELAAVHLPTAVHSLLMPMVMLCIHKHTLAPCGVAVSDLDPHKFVRDHVELVLNGLIARPAPSPDAARAAAAVPVDREQSREQSPGVAAGETPATAACRNATGSSVSPT